MFLNCGEGISLHCQRSCCLLKSVVCCTTSAPFYASAISLRLWVCHEHLWNITFALCGRGPLSLSFELTKDITAATASSVLSKHQRWQFYLPAHVKLRVWEPPRLHSCNKKSNEHQPWRCFLHSLCPKAHLPQLRSTGATPQRGTLAHRVGHFLRACLWCFQATGQLWIPTNFLVGPAHIQEITPIKHLNRVPVV